MRWEDLIEELITENDPQYDEIPKEEWEKIKEEANVYRIVD